MGTAPLPLSSPVTDVSVSPAGNGGRLSYRHLVVAVIALAAVVRIGAWSQQQSLWIDEARLALNIASRSYMALLPPLDYDQAAPLLFLWVERIVVDLFGVTEATLRLVPLASGIAVVGLVFPVGRKLFGERVALLGGLLCAISPTLISASNEAKQYGVEAFMMCLVLLVALRWLENPSQGRRWYGLVALGTGGVWLAPSLVFMLAAIAVAVLLAGELAWRSRLQTAAQATLGWGLSLAAAYLTVYAHASSAPYLKRYWSSAFLTPGRPGVLLDGVAALRSVLWSPVFRDTFSGADSLDGMVLILAISVVLTLTLVIGVRRLIRSSPPRIAFLVLFPPALMVLASALRMYPVSARTTLFFLPVLIILFAAGVEEVSRLTVRRSVAAFVLVLPVLLLLLVTKRELFPADPREDVKPLLDLLQRNRHLDEPVYVFAGAIPAWAFYTTDWCAPDSGRLDFLRRIASAGGPAFENAARTVRRPEGGAETLLYPGPDGIEVYGHPTGIEATIFRIEKSRPDPGWSKGEARRIRAVAAPGVWLFFSHVHGPEGELLHELEATGGQATFRDIRRGAALVRYEFTN